MILRRIHIIDELPLSSTELSNYYDWVDAILNTVTTEFDSMITIQNIDIPQVRRS